MCWGRVWYARRKFGQYIRYFIIEELVKHIREVQCISMNWNTPKEIIGEFKYCFAIATIGEKIIRYMIRFGNIKVSSVGVFRAG